MILRLSLDLPEDEAYIRTSRLLSRCLLEDISVDSGTIQDVENIVSELCSNVVRHAASKATRFQVILDYYQPKVVITVTDTGKGFDVDHVPEPGTVRPDGKGGQRYGGFGLSILEGLSDKIDFSETDPHGTTVRIEKKLHYQSESDAANAARRDKDNGGSVSASVK